MQINAKQNNQWLSTYQFFLKQYIFLTLPLLPCLGPLAASSWS